MVKALSFLDIKGYLVTEFGFYRDIITNIYYSLSPSAGITQRKPSKFQSLIEYTFFNKLLDNYFKQVLNDIDPDIVISLVPYPFIAKIVKKNGYLYVYWNIDDPTNFGIEPLWNAKLADVTFTIAPGMIKIYEKYGCKNVFWLMLAADPGLFKPMKVQKEFDVVFIGNFTLDKLKGFKQLLFPIFKRSNGIKVRIFGARWPTNARWYRGSVKIIVGDGALRQQIEKLAKKLGVNITITGYVPHEVALKYLLTFDVLVSPRKRIGTTELNIPIKVIEAWALGIPIITTKHKVFLKYGIRDLKDIIYCEPDPLSVANAISILLSNPILRNRLKINGFRIATLFDYDRIAKNLLRVVRNNI